MRERSSEVPPNYLLDNILVVLLLYLFATLPFAVVDFSLAFATFNRLVLFGVGALCAFSALSKRAFKLRVEWAFIVVALIVCHTAVSILRAGTVEYARELANLLALICIAVWARDVRLDTLVWGVIAVGLFYCVDVFYQHLAGSDFFGYVPRNNRYWGAFYFGAPTFGTFLSFIIMVPFFFLRRMRWRILASVVFAAAMIAANDRAPIVQTAFAIVIFSPLRARTRLIVIACLFLPAIFIGPMDPAVSNRVLALYWGVHLLIFQPGSEQLEYFLTAYGFGGYFEIWQSILRAWFNWNNLGNIIFGTGWGSVMDTLRSLSGAFSRPHSIHIDLLVSWGIVGYSVFLAILVRLNLRHRHTFVMFAPCVLPFSSFSLTSANYLFMIAINYILFIAASDKWRDISVSARAKAPAQTAMPLPDAVRA